MRLIVGIEVLLAVRHRYWIQEAGEQEVGELLPNSKTYQKIIGELMQIGPNAEEIGKPTPASS